MVEKKNENRKDTQMSRENYKEYIIKMVEEIENIGDLARIYNSTYRKWIRQ